MQCLVTELISCDLVQNHSILASLDYNVRLKFWPSILSGLDIFETDYEVSHFFELLNV